MPRKGEIPVRKDAYDLALVLGLTSDSVVEFVINRVLSENLPGLTAASSTGGVKWPEVKEELKKILIERQRSGDAELLRYVAAHGAIRSPELKQAFHKALEVDSSSVESVAEITLMILLSHAT